MILLPPTYQEITGPLVFLAGPIQGASWWQNDAIAWFQQHAEHIHLANPRRNYTPSEFVYDEQVDWETHHLRRAAHEGCILFWLANEANHRCDRAYAQTTRFELAEWKMRHERDGTPMVVGIDSHFTGAKYIRRRLQQDCPNIPLCDSLEETCARAAGLVVTLSRTENLF